MMTEHTVRMERPLSQGIWGEEMDQEVSSRCCANAISLMLTGFSWVPHNAMILETCKECLKKKVSIKHDEKQGRRSCQILLKPD